MSAPWPTLFVVSWVLAACGLVGLGYAVNVVAHARRQTGYTPVWEDWLWHMILPACAYAALTVAAVFLHVTTQMPLFFIGGVALGLLLIGIHNAWDTVTFIVIAHLEADPSVDEASGERVAAALSPRSPE